MVLKFLCCALTLNHFYYVLKKMLICMHTCLTFISYYILNNLMFMIVLVMFLGISIVRFPFFDLTLFEDIFYEYGVHELFVNSIFEPCSNFASELCINSKVMSFKGSLIVNLQVKNHV